MPRRADLRRSEKAAQKAATTWLRGLEQRDKGAEKIARAKRALKALEVG